MKSAKLVKHGLMTMTMVAALSLGSAQAGEVNMVRAVGALLPTHEGSHLVESLRQQLRESMDRSIHNELELMMRGVREHAAPDDQASAREPVTRDRI